MAKVPYNDYAQEAVADEKRPPAMAMLTVTSVKKIGLELTPYGDTIGQMIDKHIADMGEIRTLHLEFPSDDE